MTLLLVDDEPIILKGLQETYDWEKMGFHVVGATRDGSLALDLIEKLQPDVVITDVRMKKMDGLTMIEKAKEKGWKTNFVVISAYRDFEYAQKACENGALSYLVKPIIDEELERTMAKIYEMCTEKKFKEKNYSLWEKLLLEDRENFLNHMLKRYLDGGSSEEEITDFFGSLSRQEELEHYYVAVIAGIDLTGLVVNQKEFSIKQYVLDSELYKKLKEKYRVWSVNIGEEATCYLVDIGEKQENTDKIRSILAGLRRELKSDMVSAMSSSKKGLEGMKQAYTQAIQLFDIANEAGAGLIQGEQIPNMQMKNQYSLDLETQILAAIRKNTPSQMKKAYEKFIFTLPNKEESIRIYLRRLAVRVEFVLEDIGSMNENLRDHFRNFYSMLDKVASVKLVDMLYRLFVSVIEQRKTQDIGPTEDYLKSYIPNALSYIQEHLHEEELSIINVSEYVYLNSVYFGRIFKKVMNMSFKKYVQNARLERAKELLIEDQYSITEIGIRVGIPNASYFTKLFKEHTGVLPSDYKKYREE